MNNHLGLLAPSAGNSALPMNTMGTAALVFFGCIAGFAASGVAGSLSDGYFLAREKKKGVTYKTIAKRNAVLGGAVGALAAGFVVMNPNGKNN